MPPEILQRISIADSLLLKQVLAGDEDGWRAVVTRYQPRLTAFAQNRMGKSRGASSPEDVVQETFVSFLKSAQTFRGDCSLESYLFRILRYRINDHFRQSSGKKQIFWSPFSLLESNAQSHPYPCDTLTPSRYVRQEEQLQLDREQLSRAIFQVTEELRAKMAFRDLKIAEGLFFAGLKNQQIAQLLEITENEVAVVKHRLLTRLKGEITQRSSEIAADRCDGSAGFDVSAGSDEILLPDLREIWLDQRPSCPKRTTLGKYSLEILPPQWRNFVHFHVETLGCGFCQANLVEIESEVEPDAQPGEALYQSTIGFLPKRAPTRRNR